MTRHPLATAIGNALALLTIIGIGWTFVLGLLWLATVAGR